MARNSEIASGSDDNWRAIFLPDLGTSTSSNQVVNASSSLIVVVPVPSAFGSGAFRGSPFPPPGARAQTDTDPRRRDNPRGEVDDRDDENVPGFPETKHRVGRFAPLT
mmetsp:Transcript_6528/g.21920  ORF Transcript_6528/g.21920 Transcript_6528/m.21920 type:complete len:108 (+) Transcript_6528:1471-1794(+)